MTLFLFMRSGTSRLYEFINLKAINIYVGGFGSSTRKEWVNLGLKLNSLPSNHFLTGRSGRQSSTLYCTSNLCTHYKLPVNKINLTYTFVLVSVGSLSTCLWLGSHNRNSPIPLVTSPMLQRCLRPR